MKPSDHPNAIVGAGSGAGGGALVVWLLGTIGVSMSPEIGALVAGIVVGLVLLIGRAGIKGLASRIWRGEPAGK